MWPLTLAALLLGGCSSMPWNKPKAAKSAAAAAAEPLREMYRLEVEAPGPLKKLLTENLDLGRFQRAPESDRISLIEIDRLASAARAQVRSLVETEGYFNAEVAVRRLPAGADELPVVRVVLSPGERSRIDKVELQGSGSLQQAADAGDGQAVRQISTWRERWRLKPGEPFRQDDWSSAKNSSIAALRADGYAAAHWTRTVAQVDAPNNRASLYGLFDSGPLFRLGEIRVEGLSRFRPDVVRNLSNFRTGDRFSEKTLLDAQERLQRSNLFEGAVLSIDPDPALAAATPVLVRVRELPVRQATVGVGYSDSTGERITLEHTHRKLFGRSFFGTDWLATNKVELGREQQLWEGDLSTHPLAGGYRNLISARLSRQDAAGTQVKSSRLRVGRAIETERRDRLAYLEILQASTRSAAEDSRSRALLGNVDWIWRDLDNILLPTRGQSVSIESGLGHAWSNTAANGVFGRLRGRLIAFRPIGRSWHASARLEVGQLFARDDVGIPDTLLFRAGGDDSVRGYAFRSLGPLDTTGVVTSGRVVLTASGELATPVSAELPEVWWAVFADVGNAADRWSDLKPALGYGLGVRYRSPVGPLRVDLAYAEELRKFRVHLSVGVAF